MKVRLRQKGDWFARSAMALFAVVWLNMAMQPCLMAAEPLLPDEHQHGECPHCPDVSHCGDEGRCSYIGDFDFDGRVLSAGDVTPVFVAFLPATVQDVSRVVDRPPDRYVNPQGPDPGPPIYVRHCSYLN